MATLSGPHPRRSGMPLQGWIDHLGSVPKPNSYVPLPRIELRAVTEERCIPSRVHNPLGTEQPVAESPVGGNGHDRGGCNIGSAGLGDGSLKWKIEAEHPAVRSDEPVAGAVGGCLHPHDGLIEGNVPRAAPERSIEREGASVGCHEPITPGGLINGHTHHWLVQRGSAHRAIEPSVAVGKDSAVRSDEPVTLTIGSDGHA